MSDKLEKFIKNNREQFDQAEPSSQLWGNIQGNLAGQAGAGSAASGGSGAVTAAKGGFAKLSLGMKLALAGFTTAIVAVGTWVAVSSGSGEQKPGATANNNTSEDPDNNKIEFVESSTPLVSPPIHQVDIPFNGYTVNAEQGGSLTTETGTVIDIPANAFVDENGQPVKGEVQIDYREFHDAADVILSGITMKYNEKGEEEDFQTAGMMEIRGRQGEKQVFIAEGKKLNINMASFAEDDYMSQSADVNLSSESANPSRPYNLYYLDQESGKGWTDIGRAEVSQNENKIEGLNNLPDVPAKPQKPQDLNKVREKAFDFAVDYKDFPELKPFKKIEWLPVDEEYMDKNEWAFEQVWTDAKLKAKNEEKGIYSLTLRNKSRKFKLDVTPALDGQDFQTAMSNFNSQLKQYENLYAQRKNEESRLRRQANLVRSFEVSNFGIYNCDRFQRFQDAVEVFAQFDFDENLYVDGDKTLLFHVCGANRALVTYQGVRDRMLKFSPLEQNYLIAILPQGKVAYFSNQDFQNLKNAEKTIEGKTSVQLQTLDQEIRSAEDIRKLINGSV